MWLRRDRLLACRAGWLLAAVALALGALALAGCGDDGESSSEGSSTSAVESSAAAPAGGGSSTASGISVTGTGAVSAVPDQARFSFGVRTEAATAEEALALTSEATQAVIDALKEAGINDADLQTQQVSIFPVYSGEAARVTGYSASNSVSALIRDLDQAGPIVDAAVAAGANEIFGPTLDISDADALAEQALGLAVEAARARAQALADAAGVELGEIVALSELDGTVGRLAAPGEAAVEEAFVPIEPGTQEVSVTVSVTFAIG